MSSGKEINQSGSHRIGNPEQWESIRYRGQNALILAGPGSGKTFVLIRHLWYLTRYLRVPPSSVLVLTFSRAAALELWTRYGKLKAQEAGGSTSSPPAGGEAVFGTFHSVFYQILRSSADTPPRLIDPAVKAQLLQRLSERYWGTSADERIVLRLVQEISRRKAGGVTGSCPAPDSMPDGMTRGAPPGAADPFAAAYRDYTSFLSENSFLDYDDMILQCRQLLLDQPSLRRHWQQRFSYLLIDEFQDISPLQYETIRLLCRDDHSTHLFCVGDDDQAIYGFRGSDPSLLLQFCRDYPDTRLIRLTTNYRCGKEIIRAAGKVIRENENRLPKSQKAGRDFASRVRLLPFASTEDEYEGIADLIRREQKERGAGDIAIIFRTHAQSFGLMRYLDQAGLPYEMAGRKKTGAPEGNSVSGGRNAAGICAENPWLARCCRDLLAYLRLSEQLPSGVLRRQDLFQVLNKPMRFLNRAWFPSEQVIVDGSALPDAAWRELLADLAILGRLGPSYLVSYVLGSMGYETYLRRLAGERACGNMPAGAPVPSEAGAGRLPAARGSSYTSSCTSQAAEALSFLKEGATACRDRAALARFLSDPDLFRRQIAGSVNTQGAQLVWTAAVPAAGSGTLRVHSLQPPEQNQGRNRGSSEAAEGCRVRLMTMHASKGLEFDTVILPDLNEGILPSRKAAGEAGIEEERRLFYVAMTRARKALYLLYLRGTAQNPRLPSRFLHCLGIRDWIG